jgi:hypothetical protein
MQTKAQYPRQMSSLINYTNAHKAKEKDKWVPKEKKETHFYKHYTRN